MKMKAILLAFLIAGFTATAALADHGGHGGDRNGRHHDNEHAREANNPAVPAGCVRVELRGTLTSVSTSSFGLMVTKAKAEDEDNDEDNDNDDDDNNAPATPNLVGQTLTIAVDANARVSFKTVGALTGPAVGDTAQVEANMCGTPATFTAVEVKVTSAKLASAKLTAKHHH